MFWRENWPLRGSRGRGNINVRGFGAEMGSRDWDIWREATVKCVIRTPWTLDVSHLKVMTSE